MNIVAMRYTLDKHGIDYEERDGWFKLNTRRIDNELIKQIGACAGAIEDDDMYGTLRIVDDA